MRKGSWALAGLAAFVTAGSASAVDIGVPGLELNLTLLLESEHRLRGVTLTDGDPRLTGTAELAHESGLYGNVRLANVDFNDPTDLELSFTGGYRQTIDRFSYDANIAYFTYPDAPDGADYDYVEFAFEPSYDAGPVILSGEIAWSPDYFGSSDDSLYLEGGITVPLDFGTDSVAVALFGTLGYSYFSDGGVPDYLNWTLGASATLAPFTLSVSYEDTDLAGQGFSCDDICDETVLVSLTTTF